MGVSSSSLRSAGDAPLMAARRHVQRHGVPDAGKGLVERGPGVAASIEKRRILDDGFKHCGDIGVAARLAPAYGAGIAAQVGNLRGDNRRNAHGEGSPGSLKRSSIERMQIIKRGFTARVPDFIKNWNRDRADALVSRMASANGQPRSGSTYRKNGEHRWNISTIFLRESLRSTQNCNSIWGFNCDVFLRKRRINLFPRGSRNFSIGCSLEEIPTAAARRLMRALKRRRRANV